MNRWQPRLIAVDLDGTLLSSHSRLSAVTRRAILSAREAGIRVVPCSGRHFPGTRAIALQAGMGDLIIAGNGAQVRTLSGDVLFQRLLDPAPCLELFRIAEKWGAACNLYADDQIFSQTPNRVLDYYRRLNHRLPVSCRCVCHLVDSLPREIQRREKGLLKMELLPVPPEAVPAVRALEEQRPDVLLEGNLCTSVEMHASGVDKGVGLQVAAAHYGISLLDTLAFGDAENDVPLLKTAFVGAAMGNAVDAARAAADLIVPDNDHHGVARTIRKYVF